MSRNEEMHFSQNPVNIDIPRSKFKIPFDHKTSFSGGSLVPLGLWEYLPGDTVNIKLASLVRMTTPIYPVLDNSYLDLYFFSIPNRLVYEHWKEFMGENTSTYWTPEVEYTIPQTTAPVGGWTKGTLADYFGLPTGVDNISVSSLPFRAYALVYNEWFRSENLIEPLDITKGDATTTGSNGDDPTIDVQKGGMPAHVGRLPDYFSSALPGPMKGPDVFVPLGNTAPIIAGAMHETEPIHFGSDAYPDKNLSMYDAVGYTWDEATAYNTVNQTNLVADLANATGATINQLRQAFAIQKLYEKDARGGTRYTEVIRSHFSVTSPDARQQRPEYLGGKRIPITISTVVQTSSTDATSPQGNTAAYSLTIDNHDMVTASFTEHGLLMCVGCVRHDRTYSQGIDRLWSRKSRLQYYWPSLSNIGEQSILNKEIYAQGNNEDDEVFGYQEAWAEYRFKNSQITSELRPTYELSLDAWHYGDKYEKLPVLGPEWFTEDRTEIDRTLAINTQDQFIGDFYFDTTWARPMPLYSIPGLIDHH